MTFAAVDDKLLRFSQLHVHEFIVNFVTMVHKSLESLIWTHGLKTFINIWKWTAWKHSFCIPNYRNRPLPQKFATLSSVWAEPRSTCDPIACHAGLLCTDFLHNLWTFGSVVSACLTIYLVFSFLGIIVNFLNFLVLIIWYYLDFAAWSTWWILIGCLCWLSHFLSCIWTKISRNI